jgi:hypothetical protein
MKPLPLTSTKEVFTTPNGARFTVSKYGYTWLPNGEVGSISIPVRGGFIDKVKAALIEHGRIPENKRREWLAV